MRTESTQSPDEVKDRQEVRVRPAWGPAVPRSLLGGAAWVWEKGLHDVLSTAFQRGRSCTTFFSECSHSGRLLLSGPLKFRKEKGKQVKSFQRGKKDNKHTHARTNKIPPQKPFMRSIGALKNRGGWHVHGVPPPGGLSSVAFPRAPCLCASLV